MMGLDGSRDGLPLICTTLHATKYPEEKIYLRKIV